MSGPLYFDEIALGDTWESGRRTITETDVVMFAGLTGDFDPLHVDHEFAKQTPYKQPIAHGLLGMSLVAGLGSHAPQMQTEAFVGVREWTFHKPLFIGDTVHVRTRVHELEARRNRGRVLWLRELFNQRGEVVQSGIFESLVRKQRPPKA